MLLNQSCNLYCKGVIPFLRIYPRVKIYLNKISSNCFIIFFICVFSSTKVMIQAVVKTCWISKVFIRIFRGIINAFFSKFSFFRFHDFPNVFFYIWQLSPVFLTITQQVWIKCFEHFFIDELIYSTNNLHYVGLIIFPCADISPTKAKDR